MQSGRARTKQWLLDYELETPRTIDPLMGWTSSRNTMEQIRLEFDSREEAVAYAEKQGWLYNLEEPKERKLQVKAYADNFAFGKIGRWTH